VLRKAIVWFDPSARAKAASVCSGWSEIASAALSASATALVARVC
jgi:hypothetical protein